MAQHWWGTHELEPGQTGRWQIGSGSLWLQRGHDELKVAALQGTDGLAETLDIQCPGASPSPPEDHALARYVVLGSPKDVRLDPKLSDRAVVARPEFPFLVPSGATGRVFLSTPIWVGIHCGAWLCEHPLFRPSDTWFGPSTMSGSLCYASRSNLRRELSSVPVRPHRAITAVTIRNSHPEPLELLRLRLPVPNLSLFVDSAGSFWTEDLVLEHTAERDVARVGIGQGPPAGRIDARLVTGPRQPQGPENAVVRVFNSFFS